MLIGEYESKLTDKNRVSVPKKIREELEGGLIVSRGYEGCLILIDELRWAKLLEMVSSKPILDLSARDTRRFIMGSAYDIELDKQARFILPPMLKDYADINDEIVFVGLGDWVEVWNKAKWIAKVEKLINEAGDIAHELLTRK